MDLAALQGLVDALAAPRSLLAGEGEEAVPQGLVRSASFGPDGSLVITGGTDGTVRLWEAASGVELEAAQIELRRERDAAGAEAAARERAAREGSRE
ncbi:MAG: hypothetical protein HY721_20505 [Planctomycetes bacterium]|nr:hypothetical protein [Planctomycetota bacterium]